MTSSNSKLEAIPTLTATNPLHRTHNNRGLPKIEKKQQPVNRKNITSEDGRDAIGTKDKVRFFISHAVFFLADPENLGKPRQKQLTLHHTFSRIARSDPPGIP